MANSMKAWYHLSKGRIGPGEGMVQSEAPNAGHVAHLGHSHWGFYAPPVPQSRIPMQIINRVFKYRRHHCKLPLKQFTEQAPGWARNGGLPDGRQNTSALR